MVKPPWRKLVAVQFAILFGLARCCLAHTTGLSTSDFKFATNGLDVDVVMAAADLTLALAHLETVNPTDANHDGKLTVEELAAALERLRTFAAESLVLEFDGQRVRPGPVRFALDDANNFHMAMNYHGQRPNRLRVRAALFEHLPPDHYHFTAVHEPDGTSLGNKMLKPTDDALELTVAAGPTKAAPRASTLPDFLKLGVLHIWTGYDHLLFLLALLLVCGTFKSAVQVISFFTVANTLTLALAALDLVWVAGRVVEIAIATSIIYVSVENFFRPGGPKGRWLVTFSFGLVHGLGFATVLRNLGVASSTTGITVPLVGFNLGVEAGQIVVAAAVLPIIWKLRNSERFVRWGVPACSAVLAAAGAYWLIERLFFR